MKDEQAIWEALWGKIKKPRKPSDDELLKYDLRENDRRGKITRSPPNLHGQGET